MTIIDLNEIYKKIYYWYILYFKILDIIGVKHCQPLKTMGKGLGQLIIFKF